MMAKNRFLGIVGSRNFTDQKMVEDAVVDWMARNGVCRGCLTIVSGGARGADTIAERVAASLHTQTIIHKADWGLHGRSAGFLRNEKIVADSDYIMAFYGPPEKDKPWPSSGTSHTVARAKDKGVPYEVHYQSWRGNQ